MATLSDYLRRAIAKSGISHNELARQTKIPQPTITRFVNGLDMRLSNAGRLAAYFGLTLVKRSAKRRDKIPTGHRGRR